MPRSRYFASKKETKLNFEFKSSFLCLHKGSNQITFEECERERKKVFLPRIENMGCGVLNEE
jgi:hypothetical protein